MRSTYTDTTWSYIIRGQGSGLVNATGKVPGSGLIQSQAAHAPGHPPNIRMLRGRSVPYD